MANGGESFDQMIARVQSRRASLSNSSSSTPEGGSSMAGFAFGKKQAPPFGKKPSKPGGKPFGKSAPIQKSLRGGKR